MLTVQFAPGGGEWVTSFDDARVATPGTTAWNGATVDFLYRHRRKRPHANTDVQADLEARGAWVFYTAASDHMPLVCDYAVVTGDTD